MIGLDNFFVVLLALLLDILFKEPKRFHPLVGFGRWVNCVESLFTRFAKVRNSRQGAMAYFCVMLPYLLCFVLIDNWLSEYTTVYFFFSAVALYICVGWQSLIAHVVAVENALRNDDVVSAREKLSWIVSRDTRELSSLQIIKASIETLLENGADAVIAPIFWYLLLGPVGAIFYRLVNTVDAMWGYKNEQYLHFGFVAARADDAMNYLPARLTAWLYALVGNTHQARLAWKQQAPHCESPNAGPVMCAGAGSLGIELGGKAIYHGRDKIKPLMGVQGQDPSLSSISDAITLLNKSIALLIALVSVLVFVINWALA